MFVFGSVAGEEEVIFEDTLSTESGAWFIVIEAVFGWVAELDHRAKLLLVLIVWLTVNLLGIHIAWRAYGDRLTLMFNTTTKPSKDSQKKKKETVPEEKPHKSPTSQTVNRD